MIVILCVRHVASGFRAAMALGIECKAPGMHRNPDQEFWHRKAQARGMWICEEATSAEMVLAWYAGCLEKVRAMGLEPAPADVSRFQTARRV